MTPEEEKLRGEEAKQLLANKVLAAAFRDIEEALVNALASHDVSPERMQRLQAALAGKRNFERVLKGYVQTGKLAIETERRKIFGIPV